MRLGTPAQINTRTGQNVVPGPAHGDARVVEVADAVVGHNAVARRLQQNTTAFAVDVAAVLNDAVGHLDVFRLVAGANGATRAGADSNATST